jgi:uncharacterized membrane protein
MKRDVADKIVAVVAGAVLLLGALWSFQAAQQPTTTMDGSMMDSMMDGGMGTTYGTDPLLYLLSAILIAVIIGGGYLYIRDEMTESDTVASANEGLKAQPTTHGAEPDSAPQNPVDETETGMDTDVGSKTDSELLRYLPEDERRVLEPVIDSPGVTQIEIRDRSDFSKSKVSQTLSELEQRGLVYKEKQGRTFRVYPGDEIDEREPAA